MDDVKVNLPESELGHNQGSDYHKMSLKEAVERGYVRVYCAEHMLEDIKAYNALLEATRAAPLSDEEMEQIKFFTRHIDRCCGLVYSAPIRTSEPTEQEIIEWKADYSMLCNIDVDACYIKYCVKLLIDTWGEIEEVYFDPSIDPNNRIQNDKYIDAMDCKARIAAYKKSEEE